TQYLPNLSNPQLSTPAQSPRSSPTSSDQLIEHLIDPTGVTEDFSLFTLNPLPNQVELPSSPSDASFDTVENDLIEHIFTLQLGSTEYHFARHQLGLYEELINAHTGAQYRHLPLDD
ncbi:hypothetical protein FRC06_010272, partial [Ceratobasidium sp. 370]